MVQQKYFYKDQSSFDTSSTNHKNNNSDTEVILKVKNENVNELFSFKNLNNMIPRGNSVATNLFTEKKVETAKQNPNEFEENPKNSENKLRLLNMIIKDEINQIRNAYEQEDSDYHNEHKNISESKSVIIERQGGLTNKFVLFLVALWYLFSALTLYTNKYIVTSRKIDPTIIGDLKFTFALNSHYNFIMKIL